LGMAKSGRKRAASKYSSVSLAPFGGDHGPGTQAATRDTEMVEIEGPNRVARRQRVNRVEWMMKKGFLDIRQYQAAQAIRDAYGRVESLSSGGALKERVQASPKPDAIVAAQCDAVSWMAHVMRGVLRSEREIVEHVCWHNRRLTALKAQVRAGARFRLAMDRVANRLGY